MPIIMTELGVEAGTGEETAPPPPPQKKIQFLKPCTINLLQQL